MRPTGEGARWELFLAADCASMSDHQSDVDLRSGWEWMREQFNVNASYRHRQDPVTGEEGPLPVWSPEALREAIIQPE